MLWVTRSHIHIARVACPWLITSGYRLRLPLDEENLAAQFEVYDALYACCRLDVARG